MIHSELEDLLRTLKATAVLDVGCGCGHFTRRLALEERRVVGIDVVHGESRWKDAGETAGVRFCCMDGTALAFADDSFEFAFERAALHHVARWRDMLAEMIRVSRSHVIIQEPVDDLRSDAKRRAFEAQGLLLAIQAEVGYSHHRHLGAAAVLSELRSRDLSLEVHLQRSDAPRSFDEFFDSIGEFVKQSARPAYWWDSLEELRSRFDGAPLCDDDTLTVVAVKRTHGA